MRIQSRQFLALTVALLLCLAWSGVRAQSASNSDRAYLAALTRQANGGDATSAFLLGYHYETGNDVPRDLDQARHWYQVAAARGSDRARDALARLSTQPRQSAAVPVSGDDAAYLATLVRQAGNGDVAAQFLLGYHYETGNGVRQDASQARYWYQQAAAHGSDRAAQALARLNPPPAAPVEMETVQAPASDADSTGAGDGQSEALAQQRQDISDQIDQLQSDLNEQQSEAENWEQEAQQLGDTSNCSGPGASICAAIAQVGLSKAQANASKARRAAERDQEEINRLQGEISQLAQQSTASTPSPQAAIYNPNAIVDAANQQAAQMIAIGACNDCARSAQVAQLRSACSSGNMAACYRAAAALCQCQLNAGGCGGNAQQLQQCVNTNTQTADSMRGGYTIVPGSPSHSNSPNKQPASPPAQYQCPPGMPVCASAAY